MKVRFEMPATRDQVDTEMASVPREGETVYIFVGGHNRLFTVRRVVWWPMETKDFDAYVVLKRDNR